MNILLIKQCSKLFKQAAGVYMKNAANPVQWTKLFLQLGYSGIHDPGIGIIHPNEPMVGVIFGNKFLDIISVVKNTNDNIEKNEFEQKSEDNLINFFKNQWRNINQSTPISEIADLINKTLTHKNLHYLIYDHIYRVDINKLPREILSKIIDLVDSTKLNWIVSRSDNLDLIMKVLLIDMEYLYYFLIQNDNFTEKQKINIVQQLSKTNNIPNSIYDMAESSEKEIIKNYLLFKNAKNKYKKKNIDLQNSINILKQYIDKPYHYIHYTDRPELIGINPHYEYSNPIGIYGYIINQKIYNKIINNESGFATNRKYIIVFKAKNPNTMLDLGIYNENNLNQDVEKLKQIFGISSIINDLYIKSKEEANIEHPGSRLFYITLMLSSKFMKDLARDTIINYALELNESTNQDRIEQIIFELITLKRYYHFNWKAIFTQLSNKNITLSGKLIEKLSQDPEANKYIS